jgi:hypothetical protein
MNTLKPEVDTSDVLSPWHKETLSQDAQKVYTAIWLRMNSRGATEVWLHDVELSRRARVVLPRIHDAQVELVRSGLLHLTPGENQTKYEFIDTDENEAAQ